MLKILKYIFVLGILQHTILSITAQVNVDSLWGIWNTSDKHDTVKLAAIDILCKKHYLSNNIDSSLIVANLELALATQTTDNKYISYATHNKGIAKLKQGNLEEAKVLLAESLQMMRESGDTSELASWQNDTAIALWRAGFYEDAVKMANEALETYTTINDKKGIALIKGNLGIVYSTKGNYPVAVDYYIQSLELREELKDSIGLAMTMNSVGNLVREMGDLDKSLAYLNQGLNMFRLLNHQMGISSALSNIGEVYSLKKEYNLAIQYFEESIAIKKTIDYKTGIAVSLHNIGAAKFELGELEEAARYCEESEELREEIGMKANFETVLILKGKIKLAQKDYSSARIYGEKALELSQKNEVSGQIIEALNLLVSVEMAMNNYKKALDYLMLHNTVKESFHNSETERKVLEKGYEFQTKRRQYADSLSFASKEAIKNLEIEKQQANINRQRIALGSALGGLILLILLAVSIQKGKKRSDTLLLNILPSEVAQELKQKGYAEAQEFEQVTVLFTDFVGFTELSAKLTAKELVAEIDACFKAFDQIISKYHLEKIKTIGDAYMAAGGLPTPKKLEFEDAVRAGIEMQSFIENRYISNQKVGKDAFRMRVGIHTGPVVAGIVGIKKFQYDIWGDTVNTASRMESSGEVAKVNISKTTYDQLKNNTSFKFEYRGNVVAKGKGLMEMYFVDLKPLT